MLTRPAAAAEQDPGSGVNLVERALQAEPVQAPQGPGRLGARPAVGEPDVIGDVEAIPVVGLDPLHAEPENALDLLAPPLLCGRAGEVDR